MPTIHSGVMAIEGLFLFINGWESIFWPPCLLVLYDVRRRRPHRRLNGSSGKPQMHETIALQKEIIFSSSLHHPKRQWKLNLSNPTMADCEEDSSSSNPEVQRLPNSVLNFWSGAVLPKPNETTQHSNVGMTTPSPKQNTTVATATCSSGTNKRSTMKSVKKLVNRFERTTPESISHSSTGCSTSASYNTSDESTSSHQRQEYRPVTRRRSCNRFLFPAPNGQSSTSCSSSSGVLESSTDESSWSQGNHSSEVSGNQSNESTGLQEENSLQDSSGAAETSTEQDVTTGDQNEGNSSSETNNEVVTIPEVSQDEEWQAKEQSILSDSPSNSRACTESMTPVSFDPGLPPPSLTVTPADSSLDSLCLGVVEVALQESPSRDLAFPAFDDPHSEDSPPLESGIPQESSPSRGDTEETCYREGSTTDASQATEGDTQTDDSFSVINKDRAPHLGDVSVDDDQEDAVHVEDEIQSVDVNKSDYSEGILYNLIHAAQAAVEQESQTPGTANASSSSSSLKRSQDSSSVVMGNAGSVIGESSTMTRGGDTVIRSNRSNRAVPVPSRLLAAREVSVIPTGYSLADAVDRSARANPEYLSESSISETESATSGGDSDLDNFLGSFMTDFVGSTNPDTPFARMGCASSNQVVDSQKPSMPSLLEIREYLKKELSPTAGEAGGRMERSNLYSKPVLGDHLSDATSLNSQLDSVTWVTEASEQKGGTEQALPTSQYAPADWFNSIQKTLLSMTTAVRPDEVPTKQDPRNNSSFAGSFDTIDEIMQALQGAPPSSTRSRQNRERTPTRKSTPCREVPRTKEMLASSPRQYSKSPTKASFSSTPMASPQLGRRRDVDEDPSEKPPEKTRTPENSVLDRSMDFSLSPIAPNCPFDPNTSNTDSQDTSSQSSKTRSQLDELYAVIHKSRNQQQDETVGAEIEPDSIKRTKRTNDGTTGNGQEGLTEVTNHAAVNQKVPRRRIARIEVTTRSGNDHKLPPRMSPEDMETDLTRLGTEWALPFQQSATIEPIADATTILNSDHQNRCSSDSLEFEEPVKPGISPGPEQPAGVQQREISHGGNRILDDPTVGDANDMSESNLTMLGQEWILQSDNGARDSFSVGTSGEVKPEEYSPSAEILGDTSTPADFPSVPDKEQSEQLGFQDLSSIREDSSSMASDSICVMNEVTAPLVSQTSSSFDDVTEGKDQSQRASSPHKVLKRIGGIFTRSGRNLDGSSDTSSRQLDVSVETEDSPPYIGIEPLSSEANTSSSSSSFDQTTKRIPSIYKARKSPTHVGEHQPKKSEEAEAKARNVNNNPIFLRHSVMTDGKSFPNKVDWDTVPDQRTTQSSLRNLQESPVSLDDQYNTADSKVSKDTENANPARNDKASPSKNEWDSGFSRTIITSNGTPVPDKKTKRSSLLRLRKPSASGDERRLLHHEDAESKASNDTESPNAARRSVMTDQKPDKVDWGSGFSGEMSILEDTSFPDEKRDEHRFSEQAKTGAKMEWGGVFSGRKTPSKSTQAPDRISKQFPLRRLIEQDSEVKPSSATEKTTVARHLGNKELSADGIEPERGLSGRFGKLKSRFSPGQTPRQSVRRRLRKSPAEDHKDAETKTTNYNENLITPIMSGPTNEKMSFDKIEWKAPTLGASVEPTFEANPQMRNTRPNAKEEMPTSTAFLKVDAKIIATEPSVKSLVMFRGDQKADCSSEGDSQWEEFAGAEPFKGFTFEGRHGSGHSIAATPTKTLLPIKQPKVRPPRRKSPALKSFSSASSPDWSPYKGGYEI